MPVVKRGFLFNYFDKIICGAVALAVLLAAGYAAVRSSSDADPQAVADDLQALERKMNAEPEEVEIPPDIKPKIERQFELTAPRQVRDVFFPPLPVRHPKAVVGRYKEFELDFEAPIAEGTIQITNEEEGSSRLLSLVEHPVDGDYSKARLESFDDEGTTIVLAEAGDGTSHEYPVEINRDAGKTAYPPEVELSSVEEGINVKIIPSEQNTENEVEVVSYEVWRREWADPLGSFTLAANVKAQEIAATGAGALGRRAAGMPMVGPQARRGRPGQEQEAEAGLVWTDEDVESGELYSYRVRTVGANTFPQRSEFVEPEPLEATPGVDFRWTSSSLDRVGCEVVKSFDGSVQQEKFWVSEGDEIGGVATGSAATDLNFKTGLYLVDFHRQIILPGTGVTDRMVYADESGNLHQRLRGEAKTDLWDQVGRTGSRRAGPTGPFGPMGPTGPTAPRGLPGRMR